MSSIIYKIDLYNFKQKTLIEKIFYLKTGIFSFKIITGLSIGSILLNILSIKWSKKQFVNLKILDKNK